ncbi:Haloacid dehalogenase-like hydrolase domain protein, partial [mine drainage metagenome]
MPAPRSRIRAVLFDLGGTLVDDRAFGALVDVARRVQLDLDSDAMAHAYLETERALDARPPAGDRTGRRIEFWRQTLSTAAERPVPAEVARQFHQLLAETDRAFPLYSDVRRCLDALARQGRTLAVVSNSTSEAWVRRVLDTAGILDHFARVTSSGTEGVAKPDPAIFRRTLDAPRRAAGRGPARRGSRAHGRPR